MTIDEAKGTVSLDVDTIIARMACVCGNSDRNVSYNEEISAGDMTVFHIVTKVE